jgi:hypothetical protein
MAAVNVTLHNSNYTYKKTMGGFDNAQDNPNHIRCHRDNSTEFFTNIMIGQDGVPPNQRMQGMLGYFLDYTFHRLYSEVITDIDMELINSIPLDINDREKHIKPLVGCERMFLIFKGGTLMKNYFDDFIDQLIDNAQNYTSANIIAKYPGIQNLMNLTRPLDANNDLPLNAANPTEAAVFKNMILKPNFKISDTDYSLFINSRTIERYLVIHKFSIELLGRGFERMTNECDVYFRSVAVDNNFIMPDEPNPRHISNENQPVNAINNVLLDDLRNFLDNNDNIMNIIRALDEQGLRQSLNNNNLLNLIENFLGRHRQFRIANWRPINNLYDCYNCIHILSLLRYIYRLNNIFGDIFNIYFNNQQGNIPANEINLDMTINQIKNHQVNTYINAKFDLLKRNNFYTVPKLQDVKRRLQEYYIGLAPGNSAFNRKYDGGDNPVYINKKVDTYRLFHAGLHNPDIQPNHFEFHPRNSSLVLTKNNALEDTNIIDINRQKYHYISYNETIRKVRGKGASTVDFDLMRSKFNIIINKDGVANFNDEPNNNHRLKIPSEFIDVSIPRYEDLSRIGFFEHIQHHGYEPIKLTFGAQNPNTSVYAYSCTEVLEDLLYTLFSQNQFEPWLDRKYGKRILRSVVLLIIIINFEQNLNNNQPNHQAMHADNIEKYIELFTLCYTIHQYIEAFMNDPNTPYPYNIVAKFIDGYDHVNVNNPNNTILEEYLRSINRFKLNWLNQKENKFNIFIHERYNVISGLVKNIIQWSFLYQFDDNTLMGAMNHLSEYFLQTPLYIQNPPPENPPIRDINYARNSFSIMIRMVYDYGFKLMYLLDLPNNAPRNINIAPPLNALIGGNNSSYYKKYLKYKNKYLLK